MSISPTPFARPFVQLVSIASFILLLVSNTAAAYNISSIAITPGGPITFADSVSVDIKPPTSSAVFYGPTSLAISGTTISIELFATTQCEQLVPNPICDLAIGSLSDAVSLGMLAPG